MDQFKCLKNVSDKPGLDMSECCVCSIFCMAAFESNTLYFVLQM